MCIRDRTHGYDLNPSKVLLSAMFAEEYSEMVIVKDIELYSLCEHHVLPFFGKAHICLLYTSDAADERSSVDLGGRRIIKNKKRKRKKVAGTGMSDQRAISSHAERAITSIHIVIMYETSINKKSNIHIMTQYE